MPDGVYWDREKETLPVEAQEGRVLALLQEQLRYAYEHLPFYRRYYDRHGFQPNVVKSLEDFTAPGVRPRCGESLIGHYVKSGLHTGYPPPRSAARRGRASPARACA